MALTTVCPLCGARASIPDNLLGRQVQCPRCDHVFTASENEAPTVGYSPVAAPEPPVLVRPVASSGTGTSVYSATKARSGGSRLPLYLSGAAFLVALAALALQLFTNPLGRGLRKYDFSSPRAAYISLNEIELNRDLAAILELQRTVEGPDIREKLKTLEVRKEAEWKGNKILFVVFEKKGVKKHETVGFEKHADSGLWTRKYISQYEVEKDDKPLAEQMRTWESKGELK